MPADPPALWIPDNPVWTEVLSQEEGLDYTSDCRSLAESPLVIAMWRPIAESLGWPGRDLGWLDIGSLAADPTAWEYYTGGNYGPVLRLGHTHPSLSGSGTSTLLAVVQAAQSKTEAVSAAEINQPIVQASIAAFEAAVSWFSSSTEDLGVTMESRGPNFLGAAAVYESTVLSLGPDSDLVVIHPFEGTFVATHPGCLTADLPEETAQAADTFRSFLLEADQQTLAQDYGLRPVAGDSEERIIESGADLSQPATVFASPTVESILAIQELWQAARKPVNLVMLLDVSGSMEGDKIANLRQAAAQFVDQMGQDDYITLITFSDSVVIFAEHVQVSQWRNQVTSTIESLQASGNTALYDAIDVAAAVIDRSTSSETANAIILLTDGLDTASIHTSFNDALLDRVGAHNTTVFTIAYGSDADENLLYRLAIAANGNFFRGTEANIISIYDEMSAAFGGTVGVGR
jgi:Ca-activated chloride channel family protein